MGKIIQTVKKLKSVSPAFQSPAAAAVNPVAAVAAPTPAAPSSPVAPVATNVAIPKAPAVPNPALAFKIPPAIIVPTNTAKVNSTNILTSAPGDTPTQPTVAAGLVVERVKSRARGFNGSRAGITI